MTEEIAATPGWVSQRLDAIFADLPASDGLTAARAAYAQCLAARKQPGAPSDMLGAEFAPCRISLDRALHVLGLAAATPGVDEQLSALEAELASES